MKIHRRSEVFIASSVVGLGAMLQAEEAQNPLQTALSSTTLSGYVDTSAIWKFGTGNQLVGRSYDGTAKQDGFNLDVVQLSLVKPLDDAAWSAGYQVDLLFGPDAETYRSMLGDTEGDLAIQQAHVKFKAPLGNGLMGTFGVFNTPFGYESFEGYKNPNFSRSYGYSIVPRQHTGLVLAYPFTDWLTVAAGVANTCNSPINGRPALNEDGVITPASETEKTYVGAIYLTAPHAWEHLKGATLTLVGGNGLNGETTATPGHATAWYAGATIPDICNGLTLGAAYDYIEWEGFHAYAAALYATYQFTPKFKLHNRVEYASGSSGTWTGILGAEGMKPPGGEQFFAETFTVDYQLFANVISRVEFRWDHDLTARGGVPAPFGNDDKDAASLAFNLIYRF